MSNLLLRTKNESCSVSRNIYECDAREFSHVSSLPSLHVCRVACNPVFIRLSTFLSSYLAAVAAAAGFILRCFQPLEDTVNLSELPSIFRSEPAF